MTLVTGLRLMPELELTVVHNKFKVANFSRFPAFTEAECSANGVIRASTRNFSPGRGGCGGPLVVLGWGGKSGQNRCSRRLGGRRECEVHCSP